MGKGRAKSFKPAGKDKSKFSSAAASKKARQQRKTPGGIIRGRVETPKTERKRVKRMELQLKTIEKQGVDVDAVMKDIAEEVEVPKAKAKKMKRKAENKKITIVEEEVKNTMDIDATTGGTELGAPS